MGEEKRESELGIDLGLVNDENVGDGSNLVGETILFDTLEKKQSLDIQKGFMDLEARVLETRA